MSVLRRRAKWAVALLFVVAVGAVPLRSYPNVESYFEDVLANYGRIILENPKDKPPRLILVKQTGKNYVCAVALKVGPGGNHYSVITGFPNARASSLMKKGPTIWVRKPPKP